MLFYDKHFNYVTKSADVDLCHENSLLVQLYNCELPSNHKSQPLQSC